MLNDFFSLHLVTSNLPLPMREELIRRRLFHTFQHSSAVNAFHFWENKEQIQKQLINKFKIKFSSIFFQHRELT